MMRRLITIAIAVAVSGCASLPIAGGPSNAEVLKALGEHISLCERRYQGGLGVGAGFTFSIECRGQPAAPAAGSAPAGGANA